VQNVLKLSGSRSLAKDSVADLENFREGQWCNWWREGGRGQMPPGSSDVGPFL